MVDLLDGVHSNGMMRFMCIIIACILFIISVCVFAYIDGPEVVDIKEVKQVRSNYVER